MWHIRPVRIPAQNQALSDSEMNTLFVYYKLHVDQHAEMKARLNTMSAHLLKQVPGLSVDLMQRPETSEDGLETWMEVYRHPTGVTAAMAKQIDDAALAAGLPQPRRTEVFVSLR